MTSLSLLKNTSRPAQRTKRLGRGAGSGLGKTCGRGHKGMGSRSGCKSRPGYEGGQFRTFMKLPIRGFSNVRFRTEYRVVNLADIEAHYVDGEVVNAQSLVQRGLIGKKDGKVKVLGQGSLTKKVTFEVDAFSSGARDKLVHSGHLSAE